MTSNARIIADGGGGGGGGGGEYAGTVNDTYHAVKVDDDGMLIYTRLEFNDTTEAVINDNVDYEWKGVQDNYNNYDPVTGIPRSDYYDQYRFSGRKETYFIDDNGDLIVRFDKSYTYTGPK